jgi:hypothetical protein
VVTLRRSVRAAVNVEAATAAVGDWSPPPHVAEAVGRMAAALTTPAPRLDVRRRTHRPAACMA